MKTMKKFFALLLTVVMVMGMATSAFAADETYTITAPATSHQYEIYQIFTGDLSDGVLSNVVWGENGTGYVAGEVTEVEEAILTELEGLSGKSDAEKLAVITQHADLTTTPVGTITNGGTYEAAPGYYLIKDKDSSVTGNDVYTTYIVKVVGDVTISPKGTAPELDKQVEEKNDSTGDNSWGDTADYDVGDSINYTLTATLPSNYADYKSFYMQFVDTMDAGLTYNEDAKVYAVNGTTETDISDSFTIVNTENGFTATCMDLKEVADITAATKIVVKYSATLNENANVGAAGNKNTADLKYNSDPNWDGDGVPENPGDTPDDTNIVFTYNVTVDKVKEDETTPLEGAGFTLYKWVDADDDDAIDDAEWNIVGSEITGVTTFVFNKLDEGTYKLVETTVPDGYNKADDVIFTVESTLNDTEEALTDLVVKDANGNVISGEDLTFTADKATGVIATDVVNKAGATLPETGGMGTTIFYAVGAVLVIGAVVLLVTKRRMKAE